MLLGEKEDGRVGVREESKHTKEEKIEKEKDGERALDEHRKIKKECKRGKVAMVKRSHVNKLHGQ